MGIGNDFITDTLKENAKEVKEKQAKGEKLSVKNYFLLVMQIGFLVVLIFAAYLIIKLCLVLLK